MIVAEQLTKIYGEQKALDAVSFTVNPGDILGFLGPNGAGKSTVMKILTCYLPQSSGMATVCGLDVNEDAMEIKKLVGYLPEHNPLYTDMYVKEYLDFIAEMHKLKNRKARVDEMVEITGLTEEYRKKIGQLSKGYRQRVGLAQAMIHSPEVLILDEPTSGLDPNQISDIRQLIRKIGSEKTVILSTHIMQEVEAVCDRVIIISKGKIVADDETSVLLKGPSSEITVTVEFDQPVSGELLLKINGVTGTEKISEKKWKLRCSSGADPRAGIFNFAVANNMTVLGMQKEEQKLEEVFRQLTSG